jgi:PHD/YefM family antitoxin component YafN of YafNO toxin-antitoxin module
MKGGRSAPEIVLRNGKPTAVILDIDQYEAMLEQIEDTADLKRLQRIRKGKLSFKTLQDFLNEK